MLNLQVRDRCLFFHVVILPPEPVPHLSITTLGNKPSFIWVYLTPSEKNHGSKNSLGKDSPSQSPYAS